MWPDWGCSEEEKSGKVETKTEPGKKKAGLGGGGQDNLDKIGSTHIGPEMKDMENIVKV